MPVVHHNLFSVYTYFVKERQTDRHRAAAALQIQKDHRYRDTVILKNKKRPLCQLFLHLY